jgi:hypothetical protein
MSSRLRGFPGRACGSTGTTVLAVRSIASTASSEHPSKRRDKPRVSASYAIVRNGQVIQSDAERLRRITKAENGPEKPHWF